MTDFEFRKEAVAASQGRAGYPVDIVGLPGLVLSAFLVAIVGSVLIFLASMSYSRKETVAGFLTPPDGSARVVAVRSGYISAVHVRDGQAVARGQELVTVAFDQTLARGQSLGSRRADAARQELEALEDGLATRQTAVMNSRRDAEIRRSGLAAERARLQGDSELQRERIRLAQESEEAARALNERGLMSALAFRQRQEASLAARQGLSSIQQQLDATAMRLSQIDVELDRTLLSASEASAQTAADRARIAERTSTIEADQASVLPASRSGRVAALQAKLGDAVVEGQSLAVIVPERARGLEITLWAPSRAIAFVRSGTQVRLMYDAFPFQRFGVATGRVTAVDAVPTDPPSSLTGGAPTEPMYRIKVRPDREVVTAYGRDWRLPVGGRVQADLVLEKRSLLAWLFEPLTAASSRR